MKKLSALTVFVILNITVRAQNFVFEPAPPFPPDALGRDGASGFVIENKAYVGLGLRDGFSLGDDFYAFDSATDSWTEIARFPSARQYAASFSINGFGYIIGGISGNQRFKDVWEYDPNLNAWNPLFNFPGPPSQGMQTAVWDNDAYLFFGRDSTRFLKQVYKYSTTQSTWQILPDFPSKPRYLSAAVQYGSKVYFIGGNDSSGVLLDENWQFDLTTETWQQLSDFPGEARWHAKGFVYESKIYVGTGWGNGFLNDFWSFDTFSHTWEQAVPLPGLGKKGVSTFHIENRVFVGLGINTNGERVREFFEFVPNANVKENPDDLFTLFPNPASHQLNIQIKKMLMGEPADYKIIDVSGKTMQAGRITAEQASIDISDLSDGVYHLRISMKNAFHTRSFCVVNP